MSFYLLKTLHIIGFVAWFAGLFYLVRIFVYHTEAANKSEPDRSILINQFQIMEWRVYKIICNPAMMITWLCGFWMLYIYGIDWFKQNYWIHIKLVLLVILTLYHLSGKYLIIKLNNNDFSWSSYRFRLYNEVPTILLVSISTLAVFKNGTHLVKAFVSIFAVGILLVVFTKLYKGIREKASN